MSEVKRLQSQIRDREAWIFRTSCIPSGRSPVQSHVSCKTVTADDHGWRWEKTVKFSEQTASGAGIRGGSNLLDGDSCAGGGKGGFGRPRFTTS